MPKYQFNTGKWFLLMIIGLILTFSFIGSIIGIPILLAGIIGPLYYAGADRSDIEHIKTTGFLTLVGEMIVSAGSLVGGVVLLGILLVAATIPILLLVIAAGMILYGLLRPFAFIGVKLFVKPIYTRQQYGYSSARMPPAMANPQPVFQPGSPPESTTYQSSYSKEIYCSNCGTKGTNDKFCKNCGIQLI